MSSTGKMYLHVQLFNNASIQTILPSLVFILKMVVMTVCWMTMMKSVMMANHLHVGKKHLNTFVPTVSMK